MPGPLADLSLRFAAIWLATLGLTAACSGTASLDGKSANKGQSGSDDERTSADSPTQVSGAFLTSCGGAIDASGTTAPTSSSQSAPYGCVVSRQDGSKAAGASINHVTLTMQDGSALQPPLTPAPAASAWTVLFTMAPANWARVTSAAVAAQLPSGSVVLTDAAPQSHATSCPAGGFFNQASRACETLVTLDAWENPITPDFVFGLPTDKPTLVNLGWTDDGPTFGALPPGACGGACPDGVEDPRIVTIDRLDMGAGGLHFFCAEGSSDCATAQSQSGFSVEGPVFRAIAPWACTVTPGAKPVYRWDLAQPGGTAHFYTLIKNQAPPGATAGGVSFCLFAPPS